MLLPFGSQFSRLDVLGLSVVLAGQVEPSLSGFLLISHGRAHLAFVGLRPQTLFSASMV